MSSDSVMLSDDDRPLLVNPDAGSRERHVNGNGHMNGQQETSSASEDEDLPLLQSMATKSQSAVPATHPLKRKKAAYAESSSEEDTPLASSPTKSVADSISDIVNAAVVSSTNGNHQKKKQTRKQEDSNEDDFDVPTQRKRAPISRKAKVPPHKRVKEERHKEQFDSEDDDKPLEPKKVSFGQKHRVTVSSNGEPSSKDKMSVVKRKTKKARLKQSKEDEDMSGSETPRKKITTEQPEGSPKKKSKGKKKDEDEDDEVFRWWEVGDPNGDGSVKWQTLEHNGVIFPPPYEPLPSHVKMKYNGKQVDLPLAAEEVAGFYGAMIETEHAQDATFNANFFNDWKTVLKQHPPRNGVNIKDFNPCDFRPMFEYFESEKAKKKALSTAEKKELKKVKDDFELQYTTCLLDGRKEKVGNFRVEPPGLFRGRGDHPKKGALKFRVRPEDITINIGEGVPIPVPNMPGKWKKIIHDNTVTWLANWTENVNGNHKYVFLAAGSSLKGQSDMTKFEKARELKKHVDRIRGDYNEQLKSKVMADRQRATAMYFIDKLALRAGNEKGEDEADTVGCCSLRCEHVTLEAPNFIIFDFLGKDSIRYYNRVPVEPQIFKNIRIFKENKNDDDNLFDRVTTGTLNKHLASYMKGLTAKVFRTYNASITFQQQLDESALENVTLQEKLNAYNQANRMVAILCNHQRSIPKTHDQSMEKMRYRLLSLKYERMKLCHVLFGIDAAYTKMNQYADADADLDAEWITNHEEQTKAKEIEKAEKKFAKDNEKLIEEGKSAQDDSVLQEKIEDVEADFERLERERGTRKATLKRERTTEKLEEAVEKLEEKIKAFNLQIDDRDAGKAVALGTSKINYLDPRITAAWCKIHDVPIEKIFSKTLLTKFPWAMEVDNDWKF